MCVIIDTNVFSSVFNKSSVAHGEFAPVLDWIVNGKGKIVYGGSKYKEELRRAGKYLKIIGQFNRSRKVVNINDNPIDKHQAHVEGILKHRDFDDPHLVAICFVSKCEIVCTKDERASPFLARKEFYPNNSPRPKLYTGKRNAGLLCDRYMANVCLPCIKLTKEETYKFDGL
jgi:predicted nucleic acid-binding protein